ncbi:hypothetical protein D030_0258B, partial [Vibrio parahaemolyticus AQ3810]
KLPSWTTLVNSFRSSIFTLELHTL